MKKLLAIILLIPLAYGNNYAEVKDVPSVESTCNYYWDLQSDVEECLQTFKTAKSLFEVWLPVGAEMKTPNELKNKGKPVLVAPKTSSSKVDIKSCKYDDYACRERSSKAYQKIWKKELDGQVFELTSNITEWFGFWEDGTLNGFTYSTDKNDDGESYGFNMLGAWQMSDFTYSTVDYAYVELFAGKLQCVYEVSKKGKLFWFEQKKVNYNNVCPSMLMKPKS